MMTLTGISNCGQSGNRLQEYCLLSRRQIRAQPKAFIQQKPTGLRHNTALAPRYGLSLHIERFHKALFFVAQGQRVFCGDLRLFLGLSPRDALEVR